MLATLNEWPRQGCFQDRLNLNIVKTFDGINFRTNIAIERICAITISGKCLSSIFSINLRLMELFGFL